jgi:hypothetical protein
MDSDITVGIRLLVRFSATDRYGGAGPDVDHLRRHPLARRPASYLELTGYLTTLAADVGYAVEVDEPDPTVDFQPRAVQGGHTDHADPRWPESRNGG